MHINCQVREFFKDVFADSGADFGTFERELLVCALGVDLEGLCVCQFVREVLTRGGENLVHFLRNFRGAAQRGYSEHL